MHTTRATPTTEAAQGTPGRSGGPGNAARAAQLLGKGDAGRKVTRLQDQLVELDLLSEDDRASAAGSFDGPTKRARIVAGLERLLHQQQGLHR